MLSLISRLKKKNKKKSLDKKIISYIEIILKKLKTKKIINFVHSGHLGDLINSLPVIKEISKNSKCNLFINLNKKLNKKDINELHPSKANYLNLNSFNN